MGPRAPLASFGNLDLFVYEGVEYHIQALPSNINCNPSWHTCTSFHLVGSLPALPSVLYLRTKFYTVFLSLQPSKVFQQPFRTIAQCVLFVGFSQPVSAPTQILISIFLLLNGWQNTGKNFYEPVFVSFVMIYTREKAPPASGRVKKFQCTSVKLYFCTNQQGLFL